jgi:hypothetical protein
MYRQKTARQQKQVEVVKNTLLMRVLNHRGQLHQQKIAMLFDFVEEEGH